jgi:hypothetical protein
MFFQNLGQNRIRKGAKQSFENVPFPSDTHHTMYSTQNDTGIINQPLSQAFRELSVSYVRSFDNPCLGLTLTEQTCSLLCGNYHV